jgi:hypothetical protein
MLPQRTQPQIRTPSQPGTTLKSAPFSTITPAGRWPQSLGDNFAWPRGSVAGWFRRGDGSVGGWFRRGIWKIARPVTTIRRKGRTVLGDGRASRSVTRCLQQGDRTPIWWRGVAHRLREKRRLKLTGSPWRGRGRGPDRPAKVHDRWPELAFGRATRWRRGSTRSRPPAREVLTKTSLLADPL